MIKNIILTLILILGFNVSVDLSRFSLSVRSQHTYAQQDPPMYFQPAVWIIASGGGGTGISTLGVLLEASWQNYTNTVLALSGVSFNPTLGGGIPPNTGGSSTKPEGLTVDSVREVELCTTNLNVVQDTVGITEYLILCIRNIGEKMTYTDMNGTTHTITFSLPNPIYFYIPNPNSGSDPIDLETTQLMFKEAYREAIQVIDNRIRTGLHVTPSSVQFLVQLQQVVDEQNGNLAFMASVNPGLSVNCNDATYNDIGACD